MRAIVGIFLIGIIFGAPIVNGQENDSLKAFPKPSDGMQRFVLNLETKEDESLYRVQLLVGKTFELDSINRYFLAGNLETVNIAGWGYDRYVVSKIGALAGTRIGVDPDAPKVKRFVALGGEPVLIRYNSRLPVVVYVPQGAEVRYRIWKASEEQVIPEG